MAHLKTAVLHGVVSGLGKRTSTAQHRSRDKESPSLFFAPNSTRVKMHRVGSYRDGSGQTNQQD
jgi:hypothetical protein